MGRTGMFINKALPNIPDADKLRLSQMAHALMYYSRGIPVVYYGDEQGFTGDGGDVDSRENMDPSLVDVYNDNALIGTKRTTADSNFDTQHPLYQSLNALSKVRFAHKSLRRGEHINRIVNDEKRVYGFSRIMPSDMIDHLVVFNFSNQRQQIVKNLGLVNYKKLTGHANNTVTNTDDGLSITLAAQSYVVLKSDKPIAPSVVKNIHLGPVYEENERAFMPFEITFKHPEQLNVVQLSVYKLDEDGHKTLISFDTTAPYRAVLFPSQLKQINKIEIQVDNFAGQVSSQVFDI